MTDGLLMLLTLSTVMGIASFLAGSLPLTFSLSQSRLRLISTIGMGVLVGTALIVIIPEGVETLYSATDYPSQAHTHRHARERRHTAVNGLRAVRWEDQAMMSRRGDGISVSILGRRNDEVEGADTSAFSAPPGPVIPNDIHLEGGTEPPRTPDTPDEVHILDSASTSSEPSATPPSTPHRTPHAWVGLSLILGFILMYLLDTLPSLASNPTPTHQHTIYDLSTISNPPSPPPNYSPTRSLSTTLGLCIHSAADGIALGASSTSHSTTGLSLIIFFAIMVHKGPAAFGLTSILLKQGLGKRGARAHLLFFALAAPAGALGTWLVVRALGGGGGESEEMAMKWWTGVLLLFSGGTFLYVAMHTMHEDDTSPGDGSNNDLDDNAFSLNGSSDPFHRSDSYHMESHSAHAHTTTTSSPSALASASSQQRSRKSLKLVMAAAGGMLLPLITQVGHAH